MQFTSSKILAGYPFTLLKTLSAFPWN